MPGTHSHDGLEIFYVRNGSGRMTIKDKICELSPGVLLVFEAWLPHFISWNREVHVDTISIHLAPQLLCTILSGDDVAELMREYNRATWQSRFRAQLPQPERHVMSALMGLLLNHQEDVSKDWERIATWIHWVVRLFLSLGETSSRSAPITEDDVCTQVMRILMARLSERVTLETISRELHMNKSHIVEKFEETMGMTPHKFLVQRRIAEACRRLVLTDDTVNEIGTAVGFPIPGNFTRFFRHHTGLTPLEYRERNRPRDRNLQSIS